MKGVNTMSTKSKKSKATPPKKLTDSAPGTALAVQGATTMALPSGVKLKRRLTLPSLVMKTRGDARVLAFLSEIAPSKVVTGKVDAEGKPEKPANVASVADVETGEEFIFLVPAVVRNTLTQEYPDASYVGKCFYIRNEGKREGKRHIDFTVAEADVSELTARAQG